MPCCKVTFSRFLKQVIALTFVVALSTKCFLTLKKHSSCQKQHKSTKYFQTLEEATARTLHLQLEDIDNYFTRVIKTQQVCYRKDSCTPVCHP